MVKLSLVWKLLKLATRMLQVSPKTIMFFIFFTAKSWLMCVWPYIILLFLGKTYLENFIFVGFKWMKFEFKISKIPQSNSLQHERKNRYTKIETNVKINIKNSARFSLIYIFLESIFKCFNFAINFLQTNTRFPWDNKSILKATCKWWNLHSSGSNDIHNEGRLSRHYRNQIQQRNVLWISVPCQLTLWPGWTHCKG